jgi:hypothetical protein
MDGPSGFPKAQRAVEPNAVGIVQFSVTGEFVVTLLARPSLHKSQEGSPDTLATKLFHDEPSLQIWHRSFGGALHMIATDANFGHADELSEAL